MCIRDRLITSESQYDFHCWLLDRSSFEKKRSFTRETPFRLSEFNEDTSSLNEAKLLLRSSELQMVHEHVVNRCSMQVHRSTASDYLAWQKRQKINGWWTQGVRGCVLREPYARMIYLVDCELMFDDLKTWGLSNSCFSANNATNTATNTIKLFEALRAISRAGLINPREMFLNERPMASPAMKSRMERAIVINANGMFFVLRSWIVVSTSIIVGYLIT